MDYFLQIENIIILITSYLIGSIPFGLVISKLIDKSDIRNFGSGNIGATNIARKMGIKWGVLTFLLDGFKGLISIFLAKYYFEASKEMLYLASIAAVIGHIFPLYLKFKGGKGVSTAVLSLIYLDYRIGLTSCFIWLVVFMIYRISSLSAIISFILLPINCYLYTDNLLYSAFIGFLSFVILFRHSSNIIRLINGQEGNFRKKR